MEIKGRVEYIKKVNKNGTCLFAFLTMDSNVKRQIDGTILCEAIVSMVSKFMPVTLYGEWDGTIFKCSNTKLTWLDENSTVEYIYQCLKDKKTKLGKKTLSKIVSYYKDTIFTMTKSDMETSLMKDRPEFPTMNPVQRAEFLKVIYNDNTVLKKLEKMLFDSKTAYANILALYSKYKDDSVRLLQTNPYNIGITFNFPIYVIEKIAYDSGISIFDKKRVEGLVNYCLVRCANSGNTYCNNQNLVKKVNYISLRSVYATEIPAIYIANVVTKSQIFHVQNGNTSLKKYTIAEQTIAKKLKILKEFKSHIIVSESEIQSIEKKIKFTFGKDQIKVFKLLETGGVNILTGGPGTGKTTLINGIVELFLKYNPGATIVFCAPTGRAAMRLSESTGHEAKTIHKTLEFMPYSETESVCKNASNPIEADFIIVDEMSIVGVELMSLLVTAIKPGTRLLLVGDENQLPSIEPGNVLHDLIESEIFPVYRLTENFRQDGKGSIVDNANLILKGQMPHAADDFKLIKTSSEENGYKLLCQALEKCYDKENPFKMQMIEPSKKGYAGIYKMNQYAHNMVHSDIKDLSPNPMVGDKIIFERTNYDCGYVNGDVCVIRHMTSDEIILWNGSNEFSVPISSMVDIDFAYSYSIHKAQGSENEVVVIYLPESMIHMMSRSLFYTAVTRARKKVFIIYTGQALQKCLSNANDRKRDTCLLKYLLEI